MRLIIILIVILLLKSSGYSQDNKYDHSQVFVNQFLNQIIIDYFSNYFWSLPDESILYKLPLNCDSAIELTPCRYFDWIYGNDMIYGEANHGVYIFNKDGIQIKLLENAKIFSPLYGYKTAFIREYLSWDERINPQLILYNIKTGEEELIYEFNKEKFTFFSPNDQDGVSLPVRFDYYWGGIRGIIYSTNWHIEEGYTFVVDPDKKELIFWLHGYHMNEKVVLHQKDLIFNGN